MRAHHRLLPQVQKVAGVNTRRPMKWNTKYLFLWVLTGLVSPLGAAWNIRPISLDGPQGEALGLAVAAGLVNGKLQQASIFPQLLPNDAVWLKSVQQDFADASVQPMTPSQLIEEGLSIGAFQGIIKYSPAEPWSLSTLVTLCGLQGALPVPESLATCTDCFWQAAGALPVLADISGKWQDALTATQWAVDELLPQCQNSTSLVVTQRADLLLSGFLADFIAQRRLFAFWLPDMCQKGSRDHELWGRIAGRAYDDGQLLTIMGYYPSEEVVASCAKQHTEISLVSDFASSLSFWSLFPPLSPTPLPQPPQQRVKYQPGNTYVAIIVSDGDNMQMAFNADRIHMDQRVAMCAALQDRCPPLSWTISNRLATFAPYVLQWYYRQAAETGLDSFLLGPSGYGFLHPAAIPPSEPLLKTFINRTLDAMRLLSTSAWVQWDDYNNRGALQPARQHPPQDEASSMRLREAAMEAYVARFQGTGAALFSPITPSVPSWVADIPTFAEWVRWFGKDSPQKIADMLNDERWRGQLGFVYMIIDVDMAAFGNLTQLLSQHVQLVGHRELINLAHQKKEHELALASA